MNNNIYNWLKILWLLIIIPILTFWDSMVGVVTVSLFVVWGLNIYRSNWSTLFWSSYLSGWLSWWFSIPWWITASLIMIYIYGQRLIKPRTQNFRLINLGYLMGSIMVFNFLLNFWSENTVIWHIFGGLMTFIVLVVAWWWIKKNGLSSSGSSWYVQ